MFQETSGHTDAHPVSSSCFVEKSSSTHGTGVSLELWEVTFCVGLAEEPVEGRGDTPQPWPGWAL